MLILLVEWRNSTEDTRSKHLSSKEIGVFKSNLGDFFIFVTMSVILFDLPEIRSGLLPFTYTRPVSEIRVGILTVAEKWKHFLSKDVSYHTEEYLQEKFSLITDEENVVINSSIIPNDHLITQILGLKERASLFQDGMFIAAKCKKSDLSELWSCNWDRFPKQAFNGKFNQIKKQWDVFHLNGEEIANDFALITKGRSSQPISDPHTIVYGQENIFLEEGASVRAAILNAENGPIYIGKNAQIHEGAIIKGACAIGENSHVNMGAKLRGDNTIGPNCKVGGEVSNSVFFGNSNKGHDGFLGNSVIGEWCNIGADTNSSNLKNNYAEVKVWDYQSESFARTGLQFCGLLMGDHSKAGINTMFNTGTTVGICANVFGAGFPRNLIPSFSWGGATGFTTFGLKKAFEASNAMMKRRNKELTNVDEGILAHVFDISAKYRSWEK